LILTGVPKGYSSPKEKHDFWLEVKETFIFICLGGIILIMGYGLFSQGPLSIIEYILFSLMAHFLHVGETIAERIKHAWEAFWSLNPTLEWAKKEKEYSDENKH
jgi:cytochrome b subunit of formate dehydrogenase